MKKIAIASLAVSAALALTGCSTQADTVSYNLSQEAEKFQIQRRIIFFNGITDKYLLEIQGRCSVEAGKQSLLAGSLEVTCKVGKNSYKKHFLGLSDNVSFMVEQLDAKEVSKYHYNVIFKPDAIIPDITLETQVGK